MDCALFGYLNHVEGDAAKGIAGAALCCECARGEATAEERRKQVSIGAAPVGQSHDDGSLTSGLAPIAVQSSLLSGAQRLCGLGGNFRSCACKPAMPRCIDEIDTVVKQRIVMTLEYGIAHSAAAKLPSLGCIEKIFWQQEEPPSSPLKSAAPSMLLASDSFF